MHCLWPCQMVGAGLLTCWGAWSLWESGQVLTWFILTSGRFFFHETLGCQSFKKGSTSSPSSRSLLHSHSSGEEGEMGLNSGCPRAGSALKTAQALPAGAAAPGGAGPLSRLQARHYCRCSESFRKRPLALSLEPSCHLPVAVLASPSLLLRVGDGIWRLGHPGGARGKRTLPAAQRRETQA